MPLGAAPEVAITVVVPTFNRLALLPRALESLADQRFRDFEVVVVNDAGLDPGPVVDGFKDRLRIRLRTHPANRGQAAACNTGFAAARGRYLALLADDDRYLPGHLETLHRHAEALGGDAVVYGDGYQVLEDERGAELSRTVLPAPAEFDPDLLWVTNYIPALCLLLPTAAVRAAGGFDESFEALEDWELWLRLAAGRRFLHVPVATCEYRLRGGRDNCTTREVFRFQRCLERLYAKHPLPAGRARLAGPRARFLEQTAPRAHAFLYDHTVVVASQGRVEELAACLASVVAVMGARSYEVVVHAPRTPAVLALAAGLGGDFTLLLGDGGPEQARVAGARKAAGRHVVHLREEERLVPERLRAAAP